MTAKEIVSTIERNMSAQTNQFGLSIGRRHINVVLDYENGEQDENFGKIKTVAPNQDLINVNVVMIPADRMTQTAWYFFAIRVYAAICCEITITYASEELLDAMVLMYYKLIDEEKLYDGFAAGIYEKAFGLKAVVGCRRYLHQATRAYIKQRQDKAYKVITKATGYLKTLDKQKEELSELEMLNLSYVAIMYVGRNN